jgi:hypothetical protein
VRVAHNSQPINVGSEPERFADGTTALQVHGAAAPEFDREGARVAICGLNEGSLQAAKKTLGAGSLAVRADVSNLADLDAMFATIKREFGYIVVTPLD